MYDIIIIGAGAIGCVLARELSKYELKTLVLEKNNDVGNETSNANSAIVHSGYDPVPGTMKAKMNVLGNKMYDKLAEELDIKFKRIGSITLAFNQDEVDELLKLEQRSRENGVEVIMLSKEEILKKEPLINQDVLLGLLAPSAGIIDPFNLCVHAMENAIDNGVELLLNQKVVSLKKENDIFIVNNKYKAKILINVAGLYCDEIDKMLGLNQINIIPRKGEYYVLNHFEMPFVNHTLFLTPTAKGKGVLVSPTTSNNYLIGPSAEMCDKEDKDTDKITLNEIRKIAAKMIGNIPYDQTIRTFSGIRPTPGNHDFTIEESKIENYIHLLGIESPGLASAPAIAQYVIETILAKKIDLKQKQSFNPFIRKHVVLKELSDEERTKLILNNKDYGKLICRCEQVSLGEILDVLNRSCPPRSIKALKKRVRVGFGKCQGGMCQAAALKILADYYHVDMKNIPYDSLDSYILAKETKGGNLND